MNPSKTYFRFDDTPRCNEYHPFSNHYPVQSQIFFGDFLENIQHLFKPESLPRNSNGQLKIRKTSVNELFLLLKLITSTTNNIEEYVDNIYNFCFTLFDADELTDIPIDQLDKDRIYLHKHMKQDAVSYAISSVEHGFQHILYSKLKIYSVHSLVTMVDLWSAIRHLVAIKIYENGFLQEKLIQTGNSIIEYIVYISEERVYTIRDDDYLLPAPVVFEERAKSLSQTTDHVPKDANMIDESAQDSTSCDNSDIVQKYKMEYEEDVKTYDNKQSSSLLDMFQIPGSHEAYTPFKKKTLEKDGIICNNDTNAIGELNMAFEDDHFKTTNLRKQRLAYLSTFGIDARTRQGSNLLGRILSEIRFNLQPRIYQFHMDEELFHLYMLICQHMNGFGYNPKSIHFYQTLALYFANLQLAYSNRVKNL